MSLIQLPDELFLHIFSFLQPREIATVACTCSYWHSLTQDFSLWREFYRRYFSLPSYKKSLQRLGVDWRKQFLRRHRLEDRFRAGKIARPSVELRGHRDWVNCVTFSAESRRIASCAWDNNIRLWNLDTLVTTRVFRGHGDAIRCLKLQENLLWSCAWDGYVKVWDLDSTAQSPVIASFPATSVIPPTTDLHGPISHNSHRHHLAEVEVIQLCEERNRLMSGGFDCVARLWDITHLFANRIEPSKEAAELHEATTTQNAAEPTPMDVDMSIPMDTTEEQGDDEAAAAASTVRTPPPPCLQTYQGHTSWIRCLSFSLDNNRLVTGSADRTVRVFDLDRARCVALLGEHTGPVRCLQVEEGAPAILFTGSDDGTVRSWDLRAPTRSIHVYAKHTDSVYTLQFDACKLVTGSGDRTVQIWDLHSNKPLEEPLTGHLAPIRCLQFEDAILITASRDSTLRVWNFDSGDLEKTAEPR